MSLLEALRDHWPKVSYVSGWEQRGYTWSRGKPIGVMHHHTALPVPFPVDRLHGALLKCNINTKPDGTVWLLAAGACNYSSGKGSSVVLAETLAGVAPSRNARDRGLADNTNGNPLYFNFENDHAGTGGSIPDVQLEAIVATTRAVLDYYGLWTP